MSNVCFPAALTTDNGNGIAHDMNIRGAKIGWHIFQDLRDFGGSLCAQQVLNVCA